MFKTRWIKRGEKTSSNQQGILFKANLSDIFDIDYPLVELEYIDIRLYEDSGKVADHDLNFLIEGNFPSKYLLSSNPTQHTKGSLDNGDLRNVYQFIGKSSNLPIRAGLTVHCGKGGWSSTPHEFEKEYILSPAPMSFWEQFGYFTNPRGGWGIQIRTGHIFDRYIDEYEFINDVVVIKDRDIRDIPLGSHPVSAGVGYQMAYFWVYSCQYMDMMEKFDK